MEDLTRRSSDVLRQLRSRGGPLVITRLGKPAAVLLTPEEFDRLTYRERFLAALQEGLMDSEGGRTISEAELDGDLDRLLGGVSGP